MKWLNDTYFNKRFALEIKTVIIQLFHILLGMSYSTMSKVTLHIVCDENKTIDANYLLRQGA
jgi:hypothetical protein